MNLASTAASIRANVRLELLGDAMVATNRVLLLRSAAVCQKNRVARRHPYFSHISASECAMANFLAPRQRRATIAER